MAQKQATQAKNELPPPAALLGMITGGWVSQTIYLAAKLGVADLLAEGARDSAEMAKSLGVNADALYRVLRALASLGIFAEREPGYFELTPMAELLRTDVHGSLRAGAVMFGEDWHLRPWGQALHSVKTGHPSFRHVFGEEFFPYLAWNAEAAQIFNDAMDGAASVDIAAVVEAYDFSKFGRIVDVGGGHGSLIAAILQANPGLTGVLFDLPEVVAGARKILEAGGGAGRCAVDGGDFFKSVSPGGDVYTLKYIIHDWDDDRAATILKNVHSAAREKGRILLVENVIRPGNGAQFGKLMDIEMLVFAGGRERSAEEFRALFASAGFELTNIIPTRSELCLIEGVKA
jgi:hypothetical protein